MNRRLILALVIALVAGTAFAAKIYKYKCNKCKLIQEYGSPGVKKFSNYGSNVVRQN